MLNYSILSKPMLEPVTLAQAKAQSRVDASFTADDALFQIYIPAARRTAERYMRRAIFNQVYQRTLDNFPLAASYDFSPSAADRWNWPVYGGMWNRLAIDLPGGDVRRMISVTYLGADGAPATLDPSLYAADLSSVPCRLTPSQSPANSMVWPFQGSYLPGSVQIQYEAASFVTPVSEGFTAPSASPFTYQLAQATGSAQGSLPNLTGVQSVTQIVAGAPAPVTGWSVTPNGLLTLPGSVAGVALTANYCIANCPEEVMVAILMITEHLYRNPGASTDIPLRDLPIGLRAMDLLRPHVVEWTDYRPC